MKDIANQIYEIVRKIEPQLSRMKEDGLGYKSSPDEWSKKEILGHLIDSAANNHQRFVRAVYHVADQFPAYDQVEWVKIQKYNEISWTTLVAFWVAYNIHLCHVIDCIPSDAESSPCNIGKKESVPLDFIIKDYLRHLRHHTEDLLNK
jgi:hypothetical protein